MIHLIAFIYIFIGVLLFFLYRLVIGPKTIDKGYQGEIEKDTDDDFVEYEEVD